ncbi:hypothetical protein EKO04_004830 [Ascochyta lentis]|uniref:Uncharacterized protein n=1 Tax=Ascochyta lentis TaxID=205686 RepID=A0A8H7J5F9_9PLEO|nr:hypothetical protein EKO04_004830 [Ascochyta lentis]
MSLQKAISSFHHTESTSTPSSLKTSEPGSEHDFEIFHDERQLETPQRFTQPPSANYSDLNDENFHSGPISESVIKPIPVANPSATIKRKPFIDVTQESKSDPRSTSGLLALIASLENELEQSKDKVAELQGEIVAYQDALYQADEDAGYF